jgi:hypothetical protein
MRSDVKAVDISNYTSELTPDAVAAWAAQDVGLVIVQAIDPPHGYPAGRTRQQLSVLNDGHMPADAYVYLWFDASVDHVQRALTLLDDLAIGRIWLDVEDVAAAGYDQATTESRVKAALDVCDEYANVRNLPRAGIYTGHWFWADPRYMGNTARFSDRLLWDSQYDGVADVAANFRMYGGWSGRAIKQHIGTSALCGVSGVDQNVVSDDYAALIGAGQQDQQEEEDMANPVPQRYAELGWTTWEAVAINLQGIADQLGQQVENLTSQVSQSDSDARAKIIQIRDILAA